MSASREWRPWWPTGLWYGGRRDIARGRCGNGAWQRSAPSCWAACSSASGLAPSVPEERNDPRSAGSEAVAPPAPVVSATGTPSGTSFTISWNPPDTNLTITKYVVQWRPAAEQDWSNASSGETADGATSYTVQNLAAATEYLVRVRAMTDAIDGEWSTHLAVTTVAENAESEADGTEPGRVSRDTIAAPAITVSAMSADSVTISWTQPRTSLTITGYEVTWNTGSATKQDDELSHHITGLAAGATYTVMVRAVAGSVHGAWASTRVTTSGGADTHVVPDVWISFFREEHTALDVISQSSGVVIFSLLSQDQAVTTDVPVKVTLTGSGAMVPSSELRERTVTLGAGYSQATFRFDIDENAASTADGSVTATIQPSTDGTYRLSGNKDTSVTATIDHDS